MYILINRIDCYLFVLNAKSMVLFAIFAYCIIIETILIFEYRSILREVHIKVSI